MSNELVKYSEASTEELMALTGQSTGPRFSDFPRLTIQKDGVDEQERPVPVGSYCLSQGGVAVYGRPVRFRVFINGYQYSIYNADLKQTTNRSIIIKSFSDEAIDELGGIACGKLSFKKRQSLSKEQLEEQKKITCYRLLYGLVSFNGETATKEKHEIVDLPVKLRLRGDNFMDIQAVFDKLAKAKIPMLCVPLELDTIRRTNGNNKWYHLLAKPLNDASVSLGAKDWEYLQDFQNAIDQENSRIIEKHKESRKSVIVTGDETKVLEALANDLNDDISHIGA